MGIRRIRVSVCNVLAFITGEVLASFLSAYGRVEEVTLHGSTVGTAYGNYVFRLCLSREVFQVIPEAIISRDRQIKVVVDRRRPRCCDCKQLDHIAKFCPQKDQLATTTATTAATTKEAKEENPAPDQPKTYEGWTEVTRKKEKRGFLKNSGIYSTCQGENLAKGKTADPAQAIAEPTPATPEPVQETALAVSRSPEKPPASALFLSQTTKKKKRIENQQQNQQQNHRRRRWKLILT